ncbi:MAG: hypothetical protein H3C47_03640 [Candidatus Cloacimonetes bacterium]|nr:hypothetical protein [Candidatus Cloacimonadota bacterium]
MSTPLVIKKYKNRRLYDTERSCFLTREELLEIVRNGRDVKVEDPEGLDATVEVLLQMMLETGTDGKERIIPSDFVHFLIRANKNSLHSFFHQFLPNAMQNYQESLQNIQKTQTDMATGILQGITTLNPFASAFQAFLPKTQSKQDDTKKEVDELKKKLDEMQKALERISKNS